MTATETIPMWRDDGQLVTLSDILRLFDYERYRWRLLEIWAVARPESGVNLLELEREAQEAPTGIAMSATELVRLADRLEQVIDCELRGFSLELPDDADAVASIRVTATDSTLWTLELGSSSP